MIIAQANTPRFKQILSSFNKLLTDKKPAAPREPTHIDKGNYDDEIQEYLRDNDSPPPPTEPTDSVTADVVVADDVDETPPSPRPVHCHTTTSITLEESDVRTSSLTVSITTLPSEPQAEADAVLAPPKKRRPGPKKKVNTPASDAVDTTPAPTTRGTRASTRQVAPPPEQDAQPAARVSTRKRTKN